MNPSTIGTYRQHRNALCVLCRHRYFGAHDGAEVRQGVCCHCRTALEAGAPVSAWTRPDTAAIDRLAAAGELSFPRTEVRVTCSVCGDNYPQRSMIGTAGGWVCQPCHWSGRCTESAGNLRPASVTWGGHVVTAPEFTQDQYERAMVRAFADDLRVKQRSSGEYVVHHAGVTHGYRVTRERCDCPAGEVGTPCKHRAVLIAHLDIRVPHVDRQWRTLQAGRPASAAAPEVA